MPQPEQPLGHLHDARRRRTSRAARRRRTLVTFHRALKAAPTPMERAEIAERYRRLTGPVTPAA